MLLDTKLGVGAVVFEKCPIPLVAFNSRILLPVIFSGQESSPTDDRMLRGAFQAYIICTGRLRVRYVRQLTCLAKTCVTPRSFPGTSLTLSTFT